MSNIRKPWFKFDAEAWLADPHLRLCRLQAKGLLIELMAYAHGGDPYGFVINGGQAMGCEEIAELCHEPKETIQTLLETLLKHGRIKEKDGAYYIPRMFRDGTEHARQQEFGALGGNPKIAKADKSHDDERNRLLAGLSKPLSSLWAIWVDDRRRRKPPIPMTVHAEILQLKKVIAWGDDKATLAINTAMERGWRGLFLPDANGKDTPASSYVDPDIQSYAKQAVTMIRQKQQTRNFWRGIYDKFGKDKKQKIEREVERLLNNPDMDS